MLPECLQGLCLDFTDALESLRRSPFRFLLSGLGIGIGVSALVAMLSIGEGARRNALNKIESLGLGTLRVETVVTAQSRRSANLSNGLIMQDLVAIKHLLGGQGEVSGYLKREDIRVVGPRNAESATLIAATAEWEGAEGLELASGRPLLAGDLSEQSQVCLLGSELARRIEASPDGTIRVDRILCRVVGVFRPKGRMLTEGTGLSTLDFDRVALLPMTSLAAVQADRTPLDGIVVSLRTREEAAILGTADQVAALLEQRHRGVDDYLVVAPLRLLVEARETHRTFSLVMGVITGLSLLVGGIGVMNVMLANITEQTREIGLRIAVGATRKRILGLFLWQSVQLTLISGLWGLFGGIALALIVQTYAGWPVSFSMTGLLMGPLSATLTGIVFGLHPALRAAAISPSQALRDA